MVLISEHLTPSAVSRLHQLGYTTIQLPSDPRLPFPISSHPDILLFISEGILITDQTYYKEIAHQQIDEVCQAGGLILRTTNEPPRPEYPYDIRFNAARIGKYLFCHHAYTSPAILEHATKQKWTIIPTKQGYAGCSTCPVGERALITADPAIIRSASKEKDLDILSIHQGHISLPGYTHGFIGGCCGHTQDKIFFCGSLSHHPDGDAIRDFIRAHGFTSIELSNEPLFDGGSLLFVSLTDSRS